MKLKYIKIKELNFNKKHFRLDGIQESDLINFYLKKYSILQLMFSIAENGFFDIEPLIVIKTKKNNYEVIDGNLRLTTLKILQNPLKANCYQFKIEQILNETNHRPKAVPCIIIKNNIDVMTMLGYKHISGTNRLDIKNKKTYFEFLKSDTQNLEINSRKIAKTIGSKSYYVLRYLIINELYHLIEQDDIYNIQNIDFIKVLNLFKYENIIEFVGITSNAFPFKNLDYDNLTIMLNLLNNNICTEEYLEHLNKMLENNHNKDLFSKNRLFMNFKNISSKTIDGRIAKLNEELENLTVINMKNLDTNTLKSINKQLTNFIEYHEYCKLL